MSKPASPTFASLVQEFFTDYMVHQRALSPCTVASYRDTFVLLLRFAEKQLGKAPVLRPSNSQGRQRLMAQGLFGRS